MRFFINEVHTVKHAVLIVLQTETQAKRSAATNFIVSYPSENITNIGYKLNLSEAGIKQPMFILKNMSDNPDDIMRRIAEIGAQGHVIYDAVKPADACAACDLGAYDAERVVYAIDPRIEHGDLLDILRECEAR